MRITDLLDLILCLAGSEWYRFSHNGFMKVSATVLALAPGRAATLVIRPEKLAVEGHLRKRGLAGQGTGGRDQRPGRALAAARHGRGERRSRPAASPAAGNAVDGAIEIDAGPADVVVLEAS